MPRHSLKRLFAILFAVAFFSASTARIMSAVAIPMGASMTMAAHDGDPDSPPMPCEGITPTCMIDLGCIFMIGVPAVSASRVVDHTIWSPVSYQWPPLAVADGRIRAPDLRPPIRLI